ncbi:MAG: type I-E CRISPR-associated protein Cse1/CasA [Clostridiales Family XIII bacterium]|jgi:CRISPR system Cascade subunit CasA|nr:type I-E CRISPR-associated protein Cse1/CasA [Clostridiales Family XIII bacterium]
MKFNLLDEPWILVRHGTTVKEVSLKNLFRHAHEYHSLAGELPTQDAAILRVLLAVLYGTFTKADTDGKFAEIKDYDEAIRRWKSLWERACFPIELIEQYLDEYCDRFWLFHPESPFFQVAGIRTAKNDFEPVTKIMAHVPSRPERMFFTELSGKAVESLSFAQAARWLIHLQAWDYAGKKNSIMGGVMDGGGTGWCGKLGVVYPVGANLFETLMLNLVFADRSSQMIRLGAPIWEEEPRTVEKRDLIPKSYVELLTWQSRRTRLFYEDDRVNGVISSYGDVFDKKNTFIEQMSGWHESSQKGKGHIPNLHLSSRSMWRDLGALLPQSDEGSKTRRPGVLDWLSELEINGIINLCAVGYEYGAMQGIVNELISDSITLNTKLLAELGKDWAVNIIGLIDSTEKAVNALGSLEFDLYQAAGGDRAKFKGRSREQAYFSLDEPFRAWLEKIIPDSSPVLDTSNQWKISAKRIIAKIGEDLIAEAGDAALVGRELDKGKGKGKVEKYYMSAAIASMRFWKALIDVFGKEAPNE